MYYQLMALRLAFHSVAKKGIGLQLCEIRKDYQTYLILFSNLVEFSLLK